MFQHVIEYLPKRAAKKMRCLFDVPPARSEVRTSARSSRRARLSRSSAVLVVALSSVPHLAGARLLEVMLPGQTMSGANVPPTIVGQRPLSTEGWKSLKITVADVSVSDPDSSYPTDFTVSVQPGAGYALTGANHITPDPGFTGELTVPVTVNDGRDDSALFDLLVQVRSADDGRDGIVIMLDDLDVRSLGDALNARLVPNLQNDIDRSVVVAGDSPRWLTAQARPADREMLGAHIDLLAAADLSLAETVSSATPLFHAEVTFRVIVANAGPRGVKRVAVLDRLPSGYAYVSHQATRGGYAPGSGQWTGFGVTAGESAELTIVASVLPEGNRINVAEIVYSATLDPDSVPANGDETEDDYTRTSTRPRATNVAPAITGQLPLSTSRGTPLTLALTDLTVVDPDNWWPAEFTLRVRPGAGYALTGTNEITPDPGVTGLLTIPVTVRDGAGASAGYDLQVTVYHDLVVSDPVVPLLDPEFDQPGNRFTWQDLEGSLWVGDIDPVSGALQPASGRGTLIDTGLVSLLESGNGPEWAYGADGTYIVYTRRIGGGLHLAAAHLKPDGTFRPFLLGNGHNRFTPVGSTPPGSDGNASIVYFVQTPTGATQAYREIADPATETIIPVVSAINSDFADGDDAIVTIGTVDGFDQVFLVDRASGSASQITFEAVNKSAPVVWRAPEFMGARTLQAMVEDQAVAIYVEEDGVWSLFKTLVLPTSKPFVATPKLIVHDGFSYIAVVAADNVGSIAIGPTEVWLATVAGQTTTYWRIDTPASEENRSDPESFVVDNGLVVYYTEIRESRILVRRADTGLGAEAALPFAPAELTSAVGPA